jgi:hypothetical protein
VQLFVYAYVCVCAGVHVCLVDVCFVVSFLDFGFSFLTRVAL